MEYIFQPAAPQEVEAAFHLYEQRVSWMNEKGLHQWNDTDYLNAYPISYYREEQEAGCLYLLKKSADGAVVGAAVLLTADERWADAEPVPAYYIHSLVTIPNLPGAGRAILAEIDRLARKNGKTCLRLDCSVDSVFLNSYYESQGYRLSGQCQDGPYYGNRREKRLSGDGSC